MGYTGVINLNFKIIRMNSGVGMSLYLILLLKAITFSKMTKSYYVNKILEPSYIGFFPWAYKIHQSHKKLKK